MTYEELKYDGKESPVNNKVRGSIMFPVLLLIAANIYEFFFGTMMPGEYGCSAQAVISGGQWYRVFTYLFLHGGFQHLIMNMFALFAIGQNLAKYRGPLYIVFVYFTGGIAAAFSSMGWAIHITGDVGTVTIGASGAIYALLGGVFADQFIRLSSLNEEVNKAGKIRETIYLLLGAAVLLSVRTEGNVDMAAHAGGFIWGAAFAVIISRIKNTTKTPI